MVSTRGVRYKFSEGERVLCYEPDPTKAKVLYDSKVLEVIESKDKRGRRTVEYLIHFQGWNSSWDRCVSEDFVLKDTEENRQLQRDLAEKSQLQLGAYLYRRERKKGGSASTGAGPAKRARHGFSDDGSSTSTQPDGLFTEGETAGDTDSSMGSGSSSQAPTPPPNANIGRALIALPPVLRDRLTFDYHLVVKRGRLSQLPASPSAADILESFVKWFARSGAWRPARARPDPPHRPDLLDVCCRLNLVREVADGLRVYFDFIIQGHLLYKQEQNQYHEVCGQFVEKLEPIIKTEVEEKPLLEEATMSIVEDNIKSPNEYAHLPPDPVDSEKSEEASGSQSNNIDQTPTEKNKVNSKAVNIKNEVNNKTSSDNKEVNSKTHSDKKEVNSKASSVKNEVSSKTGSDKSEVNSKADSEKNEVNSKTGTDKNENNKSSSDKSEVNNKSSSDKTEVNNKAGSDKSEVNNKGSDKPSSSEDNNNKDKGQSKPREPRCATRSGNLARRLRSHKSAVSQSETEEPAPSTSTGEPRETLSSSVGSSGSSISSGWLGQRAAPVAPVATQNTRTPLSLLLDKVAKWQIIPREGTEHLPCRVYGAIHLSRLFVKLPDFLNAMSMPDMKLKLILKHIDMFVQYLEEHNEWFGEMYYVADSSSRSR